MKIKMQAIINRHLCACALLLLLTAGHVYSQDPGVVRVTGVSSLLADDSLRVRFTLAAKNLKIGSGEALTILPRITDGKVSVPLPAVIYRGKRRQIYDQRGRIFSQESQPAAYHVYTDVRAEREYRLEYESSVPYSSRLPADRLVVEHRYSDCCSPYPAVMEESHALAWERPAAQLPLQAEQSSSALRKRKATLYLEYPVNITEIIPEYGNNIMELQKLDRLLKDYRGTVWVTAYASPEGPYDWNEILARGRAQGFKAYLSGNYGFPSPDILTEHVTEDWDGLRRLIAASSLPGKGQALAIIDGVAIFSGREKRLMSLHGGDFWKRIAPFLRRLRRIEVETVEN